MTPDKNLFARLAIAPIFKIRFFLKSMEKAARVKKVTIRKLCFRSSVKFIKLYFTSVNKQHYRSQIKRADTTLLHFHPAEKPMV